MNWNPAASNGAFFQNMGLVNVNFPLLSSVNFFSSDSYHTQKYTQPNSQTDVLIEQRKSDQDFVDNFLSNIMAKRNIKPKDSIMKISEGKAMLLEIINEKQSIEKDVGVLDVNDENFNLKWEALTEKINKINAKILKFNMDVKYPLQKALKKRVKKRKAIKEGKLKYQAQKKLAQKKIEEKHKIIDKLLSEQSEEVESVKREAMLKRQADTVLHEVRKKKYEGKKMLNLLTALTKLRELRSQEEEKRGGYCSKQLTETFNKVMTRFQQLWERQIEVYKLEEKGLKIMLEENALPHIKESKFEINLLQWEKVLFGDITNEENEKLLTAADNDVGALIQVRRDWDQFLTKESTPMSSSIPPGWVLPPETDDEQWKAFTKPTKKVIL